MNQNQNTKYQVLATSLTNYHPNKSWLIYDGKEFLTKAAAQAECDGCNEMWGKDVKYEVIEAGSVIIS